MKCMNRFSTLCIHWMLQKNSLTSRHSMVLPRMAWMSTDWTKSLQRISSRYWIGIIQYIPAPKTEEGPTQMLTHFIGVLHLISETCGNLVAFTGDQ